MTNRKIIDISLKIEEGMIIYPGNPKPDIEKYKEVPENSTTESEICIGSHTGTHVDAPEHVLEDGLSVDELELEEFMGKCRVLDLTNAGNKITLEDLEEKNIDADIILLKTENAKYGYSEFREDFAHLGISGVDYLIKKGVKTVGIDYLSLVEFKGGKSAEKAHRKANKEMNVIEGLDLRGVDPKKYEFIGTPLKIEADGAPLRAVLTEL